jgi:hypothetical protein
MISDIADNDLDNQQLEHKDKRKEYEGTSWQILSNSQTGRVNIFRATKQNGLIVCFVFVRSIILTAAVISQEHRRG